MIRNKSEEQGAYCTERESEDADRKREREDRNIEINSNGVYLVNTICGSCGGKMMIGGSLNNIQCWCSRCNKLAIDPVEWKI